MLKYVSQSLCHPADLFTYCFRVFFKKKLVLFSRRDVPLAAKELKSTDCGEIAKVFKTSFKIPSAWFALVTQEEVQKQELLFRLENGFDARIRSGASTGASPEGGGGYST